MNENNMKNIIIWVIVIVVLVAGFLWAKDRPVAEMPVLQDEEVSELPESMSDSMFTVLDEQNDSGISGTATLIALEEGIVVELSLAGEPVDVAQPAHIHLGSCENIGGVVYGLEAPVNGVSSTVLDVSLDELRAQLPLAVNVHKSAEEVDVYVACGDLI